MYAIEFETTPINGMIRIPERYHARVSARVRVIVLQDDVARSSDSEARKQRFLANVAQRRFVLPNDYRFNREELYERK